MNKMLFPQGGVPLSLDDLQFMQDSFADTIKQIGNAMGQRRNFILYGCDKTTTTDDKTKVTSVIWKAGAVCLNGEIYPVEAGSIPVLDTGTLYWKIVRTEDTDVALKNGTQAKLHSTAKAVLTYTVADADEKYEYDSSKETFIDIIGGKANIRTLANVNNEQGYIFISKYSFQGLRAFFLNGTLYRGVSKAILPLSRELQEISDQTFCALGRTAIEPAEYKMVYGYLGSGGSNDEQITLFTADNSTPSQNLYFTHSIVLF